MGWSLHITGQPVHEDLSVVCLASSGTFVEQPPPKQEKMLNMYEKLAMFLPLARLGTAGA